MTVFNNNKQQTQEIKQFLKQQKPNKQVNPSEKIGDRSGRTLPIRGH